MSNRKNSWALFGTVTALVCCCLGFGICMLQPWLVYYLSGPYCWHCRTSKYVTQASFVTITVFGHSVWYPAPYVCDRCNYGWPSSLHFYLGERPPGFPEIKPTGTPKYSETISGGIR
jgi:hypothetical protein